MAALLLHKNIRNFAPALFVAGAFLIFLGFPQTSFADTAYGAGNYGSGNYGGLVVDITAPVISSIASSTGQTTATVTWTTDENADSRVDLGATTSYGTASTSAALSTSHSLTFTGLTANTTYHFRIQSADVLSNTATSSDLTLKTAAVPDTTPPTISAISSGTPGQTSATITWTTDEAADSQVAYGTSAAYGATTTLDALLVTSHSVGLSGLTAATGYHFRIRTADSSGNARFSADQTFTTASVPDVTVPLVEVTAPTDGATISGSGVSVTASSTDNIAVAGVTFYVDGARAGSEDTDGTYGVVLDSTALTNASHSIVAVARDTSNNVATSTAVTVTVDNTVPDTTPPVIGGISSGTPGQTTATIHWTTDEGATSRVDYGTTASYGTASTSAAYVTSHSIDVTGLSASTLYHFRIVSTDTSSNTSTSSDQTFTTAAAPDATPPSVSLTAPTNASTISGSSVSLAATASDNVAVAGVTFYVDGVRIGTEDTVSAYTGTLDSTGLTNASHSIVAVARDTSNNYATSTAATVTVDNAAPVISSVSSGVQGQTSATITWTTDETSTSLVDYGTSAGYGTASSSSSLVTSHSITLTGLTAATTYHFRVGSTDGRSNAASGSDLTFTTASVPDTTAPVISSIVSTPGSITAVITWTTNEAATSTVRYGTSASYGSASTSPSLVTSHSITLTGLSAATLYHFQVGSADSSGNVSTSSDQTFTTTAPDTTTPVISSIDSGTPDESSATITWTTDEAADSLVEYGLTTAYGESVQSASFVTSHSLALSGLDAGTVYHFRVRSSDVSSNTATSGDGTFTTDEHSSNSGSNSNHSGQSQQTQAPLGGPAGGSTTDGNSASQIVTNLILQNRDLFLAAEAQGITLPPFILNILNGNAGGTAASGSFTRDLTVKSTGSDVFSLQKYLNAHGYAVSATGAGSIGNETTYFGPATQAALARFQAAMGITPPAGYFGAKTRAFIASHP